MHNYQRQFIEFALENKALLFGEFTLNSGRISPYFFNAGCFNTGSVLAKLGQFYAAAIKQANIEYDIVFGPAYKGIPLATTTVVALAEQYQINKPYCFNRKEPKDHGEGGLMVGAPLQGRALIIDDVISRGITMRKTVDMIRAHQAQVAGVVILIDRQERGENQLSAVEEVKQDLNIPVISVVTLTDVMEYLSEQGQQEKLELMKGYRATYGVAAE